MKLTTAKLRQIIKEELQEIQGQGLQGDTAAPEKNPTGQGLQGDTAAPADDPANKGLQGDTVAPGDDPNSEKAKAAGLKMSAQAQVQKMQQLNNRVNALEKLIAKLIKSR